jgi:excisionase family DNA binding protein
MTHLDSEAAAVALGCSVRHVQYLVSRGDLTNHGTPRRILVDLDEIDEYLEKEGN